MVFRKTNKRTQIDMTPVVEVRMMIKDIISRHVFLKK